MYWILYKNESFEIAKRPKSLGFCDHLISEAGTFVEAQRQTLIMLQEEIDTLKDKQRNIRSLKASDILVYSERE